MRCDMTSQVEKSIRPVRRILALCFGKVIRLIGTFRSKSADGLSAAIAGVHPRPMIPWSDLNRFAYCHYRGTALVREQNIPCCFEGRNPLQSSLRGSIP